jgi:hypothetical protein
VHVGPDRFGDFTFESCSEWRQVEVTVDAADY